MTTYKNLSQATVEEIKSSLGLYGEETTDYQGFTLKIVIDTYPENPFEDCDHLPSFGITFPRDTRSIQQHCEDCDFDVEEFMDRRYRDDEKPTWEDRQFENQYYWLPVYKFDHSGVLYNTTGFSCPWDSGLAGITYVKKSIIISEGIEGAKKHHPATKRQNIGEKYLKGQVQLLSDWVSGGVYGYEIQDSDGETVDSCYGFFGDSGRICAIEDMLSNLDCEIHADEAS